MGCHMEPFDYLMVYGLKGMDSKIFELEKSPIGRMTWQGQVYQPAHHWTLLTIVKNFYLN